MHSMLSAVRRGLRLCTVLAAIYGARAQAGGGVPGLPVPCVAPACGATVPGFVTSGAASATSTATQLTVNQTSANAVLNWSSFNVSAGNTVKFVQPSSTAVALNQIYQSSPSQISGIVTANGQIYLINQNGIIFGSTAQVNANSLIASSLAISPIALSDGILSPQLYSSGTPTPAFSSTRTYVTDASGNLVTDADGNPIPVQGVVVQQGAQISSAAAGGGRVALFGQTVDNSGQITAPAGQVLLAAGQAVYLQASTDDTLRGLLVEVDAGGTVWNRLTGNVSAPDGNVTAVGLAINQDGRVSATTSVSDNGSINLLAQDTVTFNPLNGTTITASNGGTVELGAQSATTVLPDFSSTATAVADQTQNPSTITISGQQVHLNGGSQVIASGGLVSISASSNPAQFALYQAENAAPPNDPASEVRIDSGADIDVSGSNVTLPMSANEVTVQLRSNELADDPVNRNGPLYGQTVVVDARVGTPIANVSGEIAAIPYTVGERTSTGGTVTIASQGDAVLAQGATINVSGGSVTYTGGVLATSELIGANGQIYNIGTASPNIEYAGVINPTYQTTDAKWGQVATVVGPSIGVYEPGYVEGESAGTIQIEGRELVLGATLLGEATNGPYQRSASTAALGGTLIIGAPSNTSGASPDFWAPSVEFSSIPSNIVVSGNDPLPSSLTTVQLPTQYLDTGGFSTTEIYSNGSVTLPAGLPLTLSPYSVFSLNGQIVDVESAIRDPTGTITLNALLLGSGVGLSTARPSVTVGAGISLDVSGEWVNDSPILSAPNPLDPTAIDGGTVTLTNSAIGSLLSIGSNASINVSAGAWEESNGSVQYGTAGTINLNLLHQDAALSLGTGLLLEGYGFQGSGGGQLNISAPRVVIADAGTPWSTIQKVDFSDPTNPGLELSDSLFGSGGFAGYRVTATGPVTTTATGSVINPLLIATGANVVPEQLTQDFNALFLAQQAGTAATSTLFPVELLPQYERGAVSLAFSVSPDTGYVNVSNAGDLVVAKGAFVGVDPGSSISLSAPTNIFIDGELSAPSGSISVTLQNPPTQVDAGYVPSQGIYIGPNAVLQAQGYAEYSPNDLNLREGQVLAGGTVSLTAERGSVFIEPGAVINVSGVDDPIDFVQTRGSTQVVTSQMVASAGGTIALTAAEGMQLSGALLGDSGAPSGTDGPAGGTLDLSLTRILPDVTQLSGTPFPSTPRTILIAPGSGTNSDGTLVVDPALVTLGGFSTLNLSADNLIEISGGTSLSLGVGLSLRAPNIAGYGAGAVALSAPYIGLGPTNLDTQDALAPASGSASLSAVAGLIELTGNTSLQGFGSTTLSASSDLRTIGVVSGQQLVGSFNASGNVSLLAEDVYPSTFSQFSINDSGGAIRIQSTGPSHPVLEAGGSLTLTANTIDNAGSLEAPLGSISLQAQQLLTLEPGSLVSVSGQGQTIPFGYTVDGLTWYYSIESDQSLPVTITQPPEKGISLSGASVQVASGATVDLSGGGELYAYEFVPGTGGSIDALSVANAGNTYAILPGYTTYAPYDTEENNPSLQPGASVYLSGIPGELAAGTYALLPARDALLPGAFLVTLESNTTNFQPGTVATLGTGATVVSGNYTIAGTNFRASVPSGFAVQRGSYAQQLAEYTITNASSFFESAAVSAGTTVPQLPIDSGSLAISAAQSLALSGSFLTSPASGGRGANIDVSASNLDIVSQLNSAATPGVVELTASGLGNLNAQSLLLGGIRSSNGQGTTIIDVTAEDVTVDPRVSISAPEVMIVAQNTISVGGGAQISGMTTGTAPSEPNVLGLSSSSGSSALLRLSAGDQVVVREINPNSSAGTVDVQSGAVLNAGSSITISATENTLSNGSLNANGGSVSLQSSQISLGAAPSSTQGLVLTAAQLSSLGSLSDLELISQSSIDVYGSVALGSLDSKGVPTLSNLTLDSSTLRGLGTAADTSTLVAGIVSLQNDTLSTATLVAGSGSGTLQIEGNTLNLNGGAYGVSGFSTAILMSHGDIVAQGTATLNAASNLVLDGARLIAAPGASLAINASGYSVTVGALAGAAVGTTVPGLGASLSITAENIDDAGVIRLPSGQVQLEAADSLQLDSGAMIDTSGEAVTVGATTFGATTFNTPGGSVSLLADTGNVTLSSGSAVNVSGARAGGAAGTITVSAAGTADLSGTLSGAAVSGAKGGTIQVSAGHLPNFGALNTALNTGGFYYQRQFEIGSGDLDIAQGDLIQASNVLVSIDAGSLSVEGTIDAHGPAGGSVQLFAQNNLTLGATAVINASATGSSASGGLVELGSVAGELSTKSGSLINVGGSGSGGSVELRGASTGGGVQISGLNGTISGASSINADVVTHYSATDVDSSMISQIESNLTNFDAQIPSIVQSLGMRNNAVFHVVPAVEIDSSGDLSVSTAWDLSGLRTAAGQAGELTLRAAGNLDVDATISDGFTISGTKLSQFSGPSWSYQLVGGANLASADPNAVMPLAALGASSGNVTVGSGVSVRTGTGTIDVSAGRDLTLTDQTSVIYTAGVPAIPAITSADRVNTINFSTGGGDINIAAGEDIVGAPSDEIDTGWLIREGGTRRLTTLSWGIDFSQFQEGIGALGGGNVTISAGRDISNLSAVVPNSGQVLSTNGRETQWGGGNLIVAAGRDILGGNFYVANGLGTISAGRSIDYGTDINGLPFAPVLALGAGSLYVQAGNGLTLGSILNPTFLGQSTTNVSEVNYFFTYLPSSSAQLFALSGDLTLVNNEAETLSVLPSPIATATPTLATVTYPGIFSAVALNGDLDVLDAMQLSPSAQGSLQLVAAANVNLSAITELDSPASEVPTPKNPSVSTTQIQTNLDEAGAIHLLTDTTDQIIAGTGNISNGTILLPQPVELVAGRDIDSVYLIAQNLQPTDVTLLVAGRDINYANAAASDQIQVAGPGYLDLLAGRNVNLGFTLGISTIGGTLDTFLPSTGASVNVLSGLGKQPDYSGFVQQYLADETTYSSALVSYVETTTGATGLSPTTALTAFEALPLQEQLPLILSTFFTELGDAGLEASTGTGLGYARGFDAINTLFPGSTLSDGSTTPLATLPYSGDLELYFSRIYTLEGGGINILVPGGLVNVGLTTAPPDVPQKAASELGIVTQGPGNLNVFAYGDVNVNTSRIFTLDGGNITIWSSTGNIDAGKGAKTSISAPPPIVTVDQSGNVVVSYSGAVAGSGIRTIQTDPSYAPGNVNLIAPVGTVNAGDAGIGSAGNLNIAAASVVGAANISAGGTETGVPLATNSLAAGLTGATSAGSAASKSAEETTAPASQEAQASASQSALGWLDVFVLGLGEENCKPEDTDCVKKAQEKQEKTPAH
jgi:filamentous hemagglutinin family protein